MMTTHYQLHMDRELLDAINEAIALEEHLVQLDSSSNQWYAIQDLLAGKLEKIGCMITQIVKDTPL